MLPQVITASCRYMPLKHGCKSYHWSRLSSIGLVPNGQHSGSFHSAARHKATLLSIPPPLSTFGGKQRSSYSEASILIKTRGKHQMMLNRIECGEEKGPERVHWTSYDLVSPFPAICFGRCQKPLWWLPGTASPLVRLPLCLGDI